MSVTPGTSGTLITNGLPEALRIFRLFRISVVIATGVLPVRSAVDQFEVEIDQVGPLDEAAKILLISVAGGVEQDVHIVKQIDHLGDEICLQERFAARKGNASFVGPQDIGLLIQKRGQFRCRVFPACQPFAGQTPDNLRLPRLPFRVMAPRTRQWDSLS